MGNRVLSLCGSPFGTPTAAFFRRRFLHRCPCFSFPKRFLLRILMCAYPRRSIAQNKSAWEKPGAFPGGKRAVLHTAGVLRDNRNAIIITWGSSAPPNPHNNWKKPQATTFLMGDSPRCRKAAKWKLLSGGLERGEAPFQKKKKIAHGSTR